GIKLKDQFMKALTILGKILLLVVIFVGLLLVLSALIGVGIGLLAVAMGKELTKANLMYFAEKAGLIVQPTIMIGAVLLTYLIFDKKKGLYLGWKQKSWWGLGLQGCLWGIAFVTTSFLLVLAMQGLVINDISFNMDLLSSLLYPFILFIGVAISEEYLSRGYLHSLIKRDFGARASILVNSILFALLHITNPSILQSPLPLINLFLAGILFGVAREATGGLWLPIGIHFTWNLFMGNVYGVSVSGMEIGDSIIRSQPSGHPIISGGDFGLEGSIITSIVLIAYSLVIWKCYYKRKVQDSEIPDTN
ncbi:MAG TPA: type II CAAX endopeptidase family protein, partial [Bacillota bacterium]|nr:type II CAAX endopeptidase family protein [Bacillota bacterium]